jgi:hypothetical protein
MLTFQPKSVAEGVPRRPGRAKFERDGAFRVTTFDDGDGLLPGTYLINVRCESGQPDPSRPDPFGDINLIDPNYKPEEVVVEDGSPEIELNIDVPLRKK